MSGYREKLGTGRWNGSTHKGFRRWAKRQMSKFRRRLGKKVHDLPANHKLTNGYYW